MVAGYWGRTAPVSARPRSTRGRGGRPVAVRGCGGLYSLRQRHRRVGEVPGKAASWTEPACFWTPASAIFAAFLETWLP